MSRLALAALALWVVTISVGAYFFVNGYTTEGSDGRQVVLVSTTERDQVLAEMRGLLEAIADITSALSRNDVASIVEIAKPIGSAAMEGESPALLAKLPLDFKQNGLRVHTGFDDLGEAAASGATVAEMTGMLSEQLMVCTGCHAAYRFGE